VRRQAKTRFSKINDFIWTNKLLLLLVGAVEACVAARQLLPLKGAHKIPQKTFTS
jgi:hypothetical protein